MKRWNAILICGFAMALMSTLPGVNYCCCMWITGGGAFAAYLVWRIEKSPLTVSYGGLIGFMAGVVAAPFCLVFWLISLDAEEVNERVAKAVAYFPSGFYEDIPAYHDFISSVVGQAIVGSLEIFLMASIFSTAGGAIVGYYKSKTPPAPFPQQMPPPLPPLPPPPPDSQLGSNI